MDNKFRVVIVGGSIAGLTLAHCLSKLGIDYVVLEKRHQVAPQEGASVGIMPNGGRILEQLGLYKNVEEVIEPLSIAHLVYPDGFCSDSEYPKKLRERFGFPLAFLDRQLLLVNLYATLPETSRVKTDSAVIAVEHEEDRVRVCTSDGCCYEGHLVVGADGIHSTIRKEMWRVARSLKEAQVESTEAVMNITYACVYGISSAHPRLKPGQQITCLNDGWSILSVVGKNGRTFWFLFLKLKKQLKYHEAPKYSRDDATAHCERLSAHTFWDTVSFGDVWERREAFTMTPLEEGMFQQWSCKRIVCIGDSMHKFAPNIGQGANCAIEDAAELANSLERVFHRREKDVPFNPSTKDLSKMLEQFQEKRIGRIKALDKVARIAMRLQARDGLALSLMGRYVVPYLGDKVADWASRDIADGALLEFLPHPQRSGSGWQRFRQKPKRSPATLMLATLAGLAVLLNMFPQLVRTVIKNPRALFE